MAGEPRPAPGGPGRAALDALLAPRAVAVVGAAPGNPAAVTVVRNLVDLGYPGPVYPVHPAAAPVCGLPAYPSLADLPGPVEAAALLVGAARVPAAADAAAAAGAAGLWVFAGGRADGAAGRAMQAHLAGLAQRTGVLVGGPNCMGVIAPTERFACWLGTVGPALRPGRVAAVVQSGAAGEALLGLGGRVGWRAIVSTGNELVVEAAAVAGRLLDDPDLAALVLFLEGFRDPPAFVAVARRAAELGVPLAAVKVGRSRAGRAGVAAHTGALAGEDRVVDALFRQLGVHRAADLDELVEFAVAAGAGVRPAGRRAFVVTNSGGEGTLLADLLDDAGLDLPEPAPALRADLAAAVPAAHPANPLDLWGTGDPDVVFPAGLAAAAAARPDLLVLGVDQQAGVGGDERAFAAGAAASAAAVARDSGVPTVVVSFVAAGDADPAAEAAAAAAGVPLLRGARPAARALAALAARAPGPGGGGQAGAGAPREAPRVPGPCPGAATGPELAALLGRLPPGVLDEVDAGALLAAAGLPVEPGVLVAGRAEAEAEAGRLGGRVAVKVVAAGLAHKTEAGGVRAGVPAGDAGAAYDAVLAAVAERRPGLGVRGVLVQRHLAGVELLAGAYRDPQFGPVVTVGLGGVFTEALGDVAVRVAPVGVADALAMLAELRGAAVLTGARGRPPVALEPVAAALAALAALLERHPRVLEAEVNPLVAGAAGAAAADALVVLGPLR
jgi:acyl-CoA synthetase (NDP forming)